MVSEQSSAPTELVPSTPLGVTVFQHGRQSTTRTGLRGHVYIELIDGGALVLTDAEFGQLAEAIAALWASGAAHSIPEPGDQPETCPSMSRISGGLVACYLQPGHSGVHESATAWWTDNSFRAHWRAWRPKARGGRDGH